MTDKRDFYNQLGELTVEAVRADGAANQRILAAAMKKIEQQKPETVCAAHTKQAGAKKVLWAAAIAAICAVLCGAVAARYFMTPKEVAEAMQQNELADAFAAPGAVQIDETQTDAGYTVTLLGITDAKSLTGYFGANWLQAAPQRTYAVLAVTHTDGTPMAELTDTGGDFSVENTLVSPFIQGQAPALCNIFTMNGGRHDIVREGIHYVLVECDTVEPFADRTVYLAVQQGGFVDTEAFTMQEATGEISATDKDGLNIIFTLPLDPALADTEKADELSAQWNDPADTEAAEQPEVMSIHDMVSAQTDRYRDMTPAEIQETGALIWQETIKPTGGFWTWDDGCFAKEAWPEGKAERIMSCNGSYNAENGGMEIEVLVGTRNEDDTLALERYEMPTEEPR